jgi:hypothetical protein
MPTLHSLHDKGVKAMRRHVWHQDTYLIIRYVAKDTREPIVGELHSTFVPHGVEMVPVSEITQGEDDWEPYKPPAPPDHEVEQV